MQLAILILCILNCLGVFLALFWIWTLNGNIIAVADLVRGLIRLTNKNGFKV